jgi:hypothetical protein
MQGTASGGCSLGVEIRLKRTPTGKTVGGRERQRRRGVEINRPEKASTKQFIPDRQTTPITEKQR